MNRIISESAANTVDKTNRTSLLREKKDYERVHADPIVAIDSDQHKNVLLQASGNVLVHEAGYSKWKYVTKARIQDLAREKNKSSGYGLTFNDLITRFSVNKKHAQICLKHFHEKGILFTAKYLREQGICFISDTKPQQYYSVRDRPYILENLKKRGNIPVEPTGVSLSTPSLLSQSKSSLPYFIRSQTEKAQSFLGVLRLLPFMPPYIHKLQLLLHINQEYYDDLDQNENPVNKAKPYEEIIGRSRATYTYSPNGTVEIAIRSNDIPFRIATDEDVSIIFSVLGQFRDMMLFHVRDPKERVVPSIMEWTLKACDLNKDILISDKAQLTLPDIQLKYADRVFRLYVKIIEDKTYYRSEESLTLEQILPEALDKIRHPYRSVEDKIDQLTEKINQLKIFPRMNSSPDKLSVLSPCVSNRLKTEDRWV